MFRRVFRRQTFVNSVLFCADRIGWLGSTERSGAIPSAAYYCLSRSRTAWEWLYVFCMRAEDSMVISMEGARERGDRRGYRWEGERTEKYPRESRRAQLGPPSRGRSGRWPYECTVLPCPALAWPAWSTQRTRHIPWSSAFWPAAAALSMELLGKNS